jgi:hypothetical protein
VSATGQAQQNFHTSRSNRRKSRKTHDTPEQCVLKPGLCSLNFAMSFTRKISLINKTDTFVAAKPACVHFGASRVLTTNPALGPHEKITLWQFFWSQLDRSCVIFRPVACTAPINQFAFLLIAAFNYGVRRINFGILNRWR